MTLDTRTEAERRYDAERNGTLYFPTDPMIACLDHIDRMEAELSDDDIRTAFRTLRTLREQNISAALERLQQPTTQAMDAAEEQIIDWILEQCEGRITVERYDDPADQDDGIHYTDYVLGDLRVEVNDNGKVSFVEDCGNYMSVAEARQKAHDILTLLDDPRVVAAAAAEQPPA